jgi:hypothetical protein
MTGLYSATNDLITRYVNVVPKKDTIKVENRLFDGTFHVQTIGTSADLLDVKLQAVSEAVRARVDTAEATAEEVRIVFDNMYWEGIIRAPLSWEKVAGVFSTSFEFLVIRTGTL